MRKQATRRPIPQKVGGDRVLVRHQQPVATNVTKGPVLKGNKWKSTFVPT